MIKKKSGDKVTNKNSKTPRAEIKLW